MTIENILISVKKCIPLQYTSIVFFTSPIAASTCFNISSALSTLRDFPTGKLFLPILE